MKVIYRSLAPDRTPVSEVMTTEVELIDQTCLPPRRCA